MPWSEIDCRSYREAQELVGWFRSAVRGWMPISGIFWVFIWTMMASSSVQAAPSFDCEMANTPVEREICASTVLAELDMELAEEYRRFLSSLPEGKIPVGQQLQRLWIRGRDARCTPDRAQSEGRNEPYFNWSIVPHELNPKAPDDFGSCLEEYYQNALYAFSQGALVSYVFLDSDQQHYPLGLPNMEAIILAAEVEASQAEIEAMGSEGQYWSRKVQIQSGGGSHELFEEYLVGCPNCIYGEDEHVIELRFYLTRHGTFYSALRVYHGERAGQCIHNDSLNLRFFDANAEGVEWYSGLADGLLIAFAHLACGTSSDRYAFWRVNSDGLEFYHSRNVRHYYWVRLPRFERTLVDHEHGTYVKLDSVDTSRDTLWGTPYTELAEPVVPLIGDTNASEEVSACHAVADVLYRYLRIKEEAAAQNIGYPQAFFIVQEVLGAEHVASISEDFRTAAEGFLFYLERAREVDGWEPKLADAYSGPS